MKRLILTLAVLGLICGPGRAASPDEQNTIYLPVVSRGWCTMSDWKIVVPESTTNKALNPSAEKSGNYAALGGATVTRVTYSKWGLRSYRVQTSANNDGVSLTLGALANAAHYVTMRVRGTLPANWDWSLDDSNYSAPTAIETLDANWTLYGLAFVAGQANGSTTLYVRQNGSGSGDFYIDGIQVEEKGYWTTYCDGEQDGCEWNGAAHESSSQRSAQSRAGGRARDLLDDYDFAVSDALGAGAAQMVLGVDEYALLPGGELSSIKTPARRFTLVGVLTDSDWTGRSDLYAARKDLVEALAPDAYPKDADGYQAVRLRFTGGAVQKEIAAHYEGGLEGAIGPGNIKFEKVGLRFLADDPFWHEVGYSAAELDSNDSATVRYAVGRLKSTGQWDDLGLTSNPASVTSDLEAILVASDGRIYFGGNFTDWDGVTGADYLVYYNPFTDTWSRVGGASAFNGMVLALAEGPDGTIYCGGTFTNAGGDAAADALAKYDPDTDTVSAVSGGGVSAVSALAIGLDGTLYIGGSFTNWGGIGNADRIASWDGSSYAALGTGMNGQVDDLAIGPDGTLYAGGQFTTAGGVTVNYVAQWDGSAWSALGEALDNLVNAVAVDKSGNLYAGGSFLNIGSEAVDRIAMWNGIAWIELGGGVSGGDVQDIVIAPDGMVYAAGFFDTAGGITLPNRSAKWNGASWAHLDADFPAPDTITAIAFGPADAVATSNYDIWLFIYASGTAAFSGSVTANNAGTSPAYPLIVISRSGGTGATIYSVRNETTGKELLFDYDLQDGETLYIDLSPTKKSITSSFYGPRPDAILANSDFGEWALQPGDNEVTCFVNESGSPTVTAYMVWQDTYKSND